MTSSAPGRVRPWLPTAALAAICYVPLLLTHPGKVGADTKSYLYFDPGRLLERAASMWDPNVGMGTVTHQNIGYLWPMGPWFWTFERLGAPDWVAQRLWLASILFLSGLGVRYLLRTLGQQGLPVAASMFVYAMSPYVLTLGARISALLLPFVGLPWMLGLTIRAVRQRSWLHPALFALLVPTIGSTNATALLLAGIAPVMWILFAVLVLREATWREGLAVTARIGVLTIGTSLWWMAGLYCQGAYGIDVLRYTETARTVALSSTAPELLRGLGYWFFYGDDKLGPWIEPSLPYTQSPSLILTTYGLAVVGLLAAGAVRWRYRAYFVGLVVSGLVVGVGAHPWDDAPLVGRTIKTFLLSDAGLAMRSLPRAVPLITLGLSVLIGLALTAITDWTRRFARPLAAGVIVLAIAGLPPLWTGDMVATNLERPEALPDYWLDAAAHIDSRGLDPQGPGWATRVVEMPGADFASYRWGNTVDPLTPGITDRPFAARELIPYGTPPSADLLNALDRQLQETVLDPESLAPVLRLMAAGDLVLRADLQYERYNLPRPRQMWHFLTGAPDLGTPTGFGGDDPNVPDPALPLEDEQELSADPALPDPPKVAVFPVEKPVDIVRARDATVPVILAGDAEGLINAAGAGLITGNELVLYSASFAGDTAALEREIDQPGAVLVVTDSNRRSGRRWGTVHENNGYTEQAGEVPLVRDPSDNRLPVFPDADDSARTVALHEGGVSAQATAYGNPVTFTPEDRASNAVDDDMMTGWSVGGFSPVDGERLELTYAAERTTDRIRFVQSTQGAPNRWITQVRLRFDGGEPVDLDLAEPSRRAPGQWVEFPKQTFEHLSIELLSTDAGPRDTYDGLSAVGFADVRLGDGDVRLDEVIRPPLDLLDEAGADSADHPLAILLTRLRSRPVAALRTDEETSIVRRIVLPTAREVAITGQARLSSRAPITVMDSLQGVRAADGGTLTTDASRVIPGSLRANPASAIDGDPATHWSPGFLGQAGEFVRYDLEQPISFDRMDLTLLNDGRHSVPTRLRIEADGEPVAAMDLPALPDQDIKNGTVTVPLRFPEVTGRSITVVVEAVRSVKTNDWISKDPVEMPVGLAELGIPGLAAAFDTGPFDSGCRSDLLRIDGRPVPIRVTGSRADALDGQPLEIATCDGRPLSLAKGSHDIRSAIGRDLGLDLDQLLLASDAPDGRSALADTDAGSSPSTRVISQRRDAYTIEVGPRAEDTWLVLGQSHSLGWTASVDGRDLGEPTLVDGYANGWRVPAGADPATVELRWTPQRVVWGAIAVSLLVTVSLLVLVSVALLRRKRSGTVMPAALAGDQPDTFDPRLLVRSAGGRPGRAGALAVVLAAALVGGALMGPVPGIVLGALVLLPLRLRRARAVTTLGPAVLLGLAGLFTFASQVRNRLPAGFDWPQYFEEAHPVAYIGVLLLAADVVVDRLWTGHWARERPGHPTEERHHPEERHDAEEQADG